MEVVSAPTIVTLRFPGWMPFSRPAILEKQLRRPTPDVVVIARGDQRSVAPQNQQPADAPRNGGGGGVGGDNHVLHDSDADAGGRKRRRL